MDDTVREMRKQRVGESNVERVGAVPATVHVTLAMCALVGGRAGACTANACAGCDWEWD